MTRVDLHGYSDGPFSLSEQGRAYEGQTAEDREKAARKATRKAENDDLSYLTTMD